MVEVLHDILSLIVDYAILLFEFSGVFILVVTGIRGMIQNIKSDPYTRLNLARGMAMGLEFKLGSEILRTVVVRDYKEIITVGGIILLRAALTFLIHWEIKNEELKYSNAEIEEHKINK